MALTQQQRETIAFYVRNYLLRTADTPGHEKGRQRANARWMHTLNVLQNLDLILEGEKSPADVRDVCHVAALFHDVDHYTVELAYHALRGAETASRFLKKEGYDAAFIERVAAAIRDHYIDIDEEHSIEEQLSHIMANTSLEGRMVMDADTLDKIGVSNILQSAVTIAGSKRPVADLARELTSGWPLQRASLWRQMLTTPTGKTIGEKRFAFYEQFLNEIAAEIVTIDPFPGATQTQEVAQVK